MNKSKQGAAVAVVALGLIVVVGAAFLMTELRKERQERQRLEQETGELRAEIEKLEAQHRRALTTF